MLMKKIRLGDLLIQNGKINTEELKRALEIQRNLTSHKKLGEILIEEGLISEDEVMQVIANQLGIELVDFSNIELNFLLLRRVPVAVLDKYGAIPIQEHPKDVVVAFIDPMDVDARTTIQRYLKKPIKPTIALSKDIKKHINQLKNREKANSLIEQMKKELSGATEDIEEDDESATMKLFNISYHYLLAKGQVISI